MSRINGKTKMCVVVSACNFTSLKDGIKALLIALMQRGGGSRPGDSLEPTGTLNGPCIPGLSDQLPAFCPPPLTCNKQGVCVIIKLKI